ncbi:sugar ABC transporter permease [Mahella sp.]|uniref:carbohydrate ABC transporter permease n=1 Tax=Mahella sp. TaxID=2798721 RepID=UPI0025B98FE3|nr:sugar ABC transporter permease [Mahella sp.]MBZ4665142.1 sugar transporter permease [Mahella sp.]
MNKVMENKKYILLFVLPAFLIYLCFSLIPIIYNFIISMYSTDLMSPGIFVGLKNYISLFTQDDIFWQALGNNMLMVIGSLIAHMPLALLFANILFNKIKGSRFFQTVFFLPNVISGVAVGLMWSFMYNSQFGLVNEFLSLIGLGRFSQDWLANPKTAIFAIIIVVMWQYVGYHMIIQLAAMKNIPSSLYEAAEIDGASKWKQFTNITLPLIKNVLRIDAVLIITGSLKYYDLVAVMTGGGPNHATELMSSYMYYRGFRTLKYGYASAIGVILLALCVLSLVISNIAFKSEDIQY